MTGSGLGTPGVGATSDSASDAISALTHELFLADAKHALGSQRHERHQAEPNEHELHLLRVSRVECVAEPSLGLGLGHEAIEEEEEELEHDRAGDGAKDRACTAENHDHVEEERDSGEESIGGHALLLDDEQHPGHSSQGATNHEALELQEEDVLAH